MGGLWEASNILLSDLGDGLNEALVSWFTELYTYDLGTFYKYVILH